MAEDMIDRAAIAMRKAWGAQPDCAGEIYMEERRAMARAALLAALDPDDDALVEVIAKALYDSKPPKDADDFTYDAQRVIFALHRIAQGVSVSQEQVREKRACGPEGE